MESDEKEAVGLDVPDEHIAAIAQAMVDAAMEKCEELGYAIEGEGADMTAAIHVIATGALAVSVMAVAKEMGISDAGGLFARSVFTYSQAMVQNALNELLHPKPEGSGDGN